MHLLFNTNKSNIYHENDYGSFNDKENDDINT